MTTTKNETPTVSPTDYPQITLSSRSRSPNSQQTVSPFVLSATQHPRLQNRVDEAPYVYIIRPQDTLWGIANQLGLPLSALLNATQGSWQLNAGERLIIPRPSKLATPDTAFNPQIMLSEPNCQFMAGNRLACLGWAYNQSASAVSTIAIYVTLEDARGKVIAEARTTTAYHLLLPEERAPFRVIFPNIQKDDFRAFAHLGAVTPPTVLLRTLSAHHDIEFTESYLGYTYVTIDTRILPEQAIGSARVIATIFTQDEWVVGYGVAEIDERYAHAQQSGHVMTVIIPKRGDDGPLYHQLHVEAYIRDES